ncbi:MAG TPA: hypothetical protein VNT75_32295, partial [Symbiobacteriaceae bacterium]|nr:hypothetical protein [Symbiobacteriaceae bacterium]
MSDPREAIHRHDLPRTPQKTFYVEIGFVVAYLVVQTLVGWDTFFIFLLQGGLVIALGRWGKRVVWSSARAYVWALAGIVAELVLAAPGLL